MFCKKGVLEISQNSQENTKKCNIWVLRESVYAYNVVSYYKQIKVHRIKLSIREKKTEQNNDNNDKTTKYCNFARPQFVDTLFIVRLRPNMSMRPAVIINY